MFAVSLLAGRAFAVVAHGDAEGPENVRDILCHWLVSMGLHQAGAQAALGTYVGYYEPYATSHEALDADADVQEEVRQVARSMVNAVAELRAGRLQPPDRGLKRPRPK